MATSTVGLVLSGGGAKGAYHVGVMRALREMNVNVDMIAGTSIGALNGAVLASAPSLDVGTDRLIELWHALSEQNPIPFDAKIRLDLPNFKHFSTYVKLLASAGLRLNPFLCLFWMSDIAEIHSLCSDKVLREKMDKYLDIQSLQTSLPLHVAVYPQNHQGGALYDVFSGVKDLFKTEVLGKENRLAEFLHIQSLSENEQKEMILASAAIPLLFEAQKRAGGRYTDGGQAGMLKSQGNTPIEPLIKAGCTHIIVVHLDGGSLWHRHDFGGVSVIEIRPSIDMGGFNQMFDFSKVTIDKLSQAGYQDVKTALSNVKESLSAMYAMRHSTDKLMTKVADDVGKNNMDSAMARLRALK